jgi:6-phosphogluconate dehydrogenase
MNYDIGMIGLAVMGENLARNMASNGFNVAAYDINPITVQSFNKRFAKTPSMMAFDTLKTFIDSLESPKKVMLMIKAGKPVDEVIDQLIPLLSSGDIIIDGGNSNYTDTVRRVNYVEEHGIYFVGSGVSGGEEGALKGPSIMPGGSQKAWEHIEPIFTKIAAKTKDNQVCTRWIGPSGSGHFVKMVHNGIEYGDIQLISEVYHILKSILKLNATEMSSLFKKWNNSELDSYLIEITSRILEVKDVDGEPLVDKILDTAGQKGTGKWTAVESLLQGSTLSVITEAVYSRFLSSILEERKIASEHYPKEDIPFIGDKKKTIQMIQDALYVSKIMSYAQGFDLLSKTSKANNWALDLGGISMIWRGGCIIRSAFLSKINDAYQKNRNLQNLLLDDFFKSEIKSRMNSLRDVVSLAIRHSIPVPTLSMSIAYFDAYTSKRLPANLLQAQRDYFGAHTYERIDRKRGEFFHTNWTGKGGTTSSTTYEV